MESLTKREIVTLVRSGTAVVVWITKNGAVVWTPGHDLLLLPKTTASFFDEFEHLVPLVIVQGKAGIAATDPSWDGSDTFTCDNPHCGCVKDMDDNVHDNLWQRGKRPKTRRTLRRCRKLN
jgi:hypothetical protein